MVQPKTKDRQRQQIQLSFTEQIDLLKILLFNIREVYSTVLARYAQIKNERRLKQFIQDVTHQLVTPLSGLRAICEVLLDVPMEWDLREQRLRTLFEQAGMLQRYAVNFGYSARNGETIFDSSEARFEWIDADKLIRILIDCAKSFQGKARDRRISGPSIYEKTFQGFPTLLLDQRLFEILILNLYDNAVKYSYEGRPIIITGRKLAEHVELRFTNYGVPIRSEDISRM